MKKFLFAVGILFCSALQAQQNPQYTMYRFNPLVFNPAAAGSRDALSLAGTFRAQWVGIDGAPMTGSFSVHSPLPNDRLAVGLTYTIDRIGPTMTNTISGAFAYRLPVGKSKKIKVSFGISAGVQNYRSALSTVQTNGGAGSDPSFQSNINLWIPQVGAGVYVYSDKFYVGVAVPQLLPNSLMKKNMLGLDSTSAHQYYQLYATAGYVFSLGKKVKFIPSTMMKYVPKYAPIDFDFNATFVFIDRIWIGASYRLSDSYGFMASFLITPQLRVAYAYDLTVSPLSKFTTGSHEIMLGYDFQTIKSRVVNPRTVRYF